MSSIVSGSGKAVVQSQDKLFAQALLSGVIPDGKDQARLFRAEGLMPILSATGDSQTAAFAATAYEMARLQCLPSVYEALNARGIRFLVFKGAALAYMVYEKPWHRTRNDTDIIIEALDRDSVFELLQSQGFHAHSQIPGSHVMGECSFSKSDTFGMTHTIDVHWRLNNNWQLSNVADFDDLWADRMPVPDMPLGTFTCSFEWALIISAIHRLAHVKYIAYEEAGFQRVEADFTLWIYDVHLIAKTLTAQGWCRLGQLAVERGVAGIVLASLARSEALFETPVPSDFKARLDGLAPGIDLEDFSRRFGSLSQNLDALPTLRDKCQFLWQQCFPGSGYMHGRYGRGLLPWLYCKRLFKGVIQRL